MASDSDINLLSRQTRHRALSAACIVSGIVFANAAFFRFQQDDNACLLPVSWITSLKSYSLLGLVGCPLGLSQISKSTVFSMEVHFWFWTALLIALVNVFTFTPNHRIRLASITVLIALVVTGLVGNYQLSQSYD
jgi:hypothetical protein